MQTENKKGFQVKDLIVTALLSLCALVIYILCAFLSFSPYTMLVVSPLWSLLAAITYFLVAAKTKKPWTLFIFCAITGIYGFYPPMIICCIIAGIISALIAWKTGCTNGKTLTISYIIYMVLAAFSGTYIANAFLLYFPVISVFLFLDLFPFLLKDIKIAVINISPIHNV